MQQNFQQELTVNFWNIEVILPVCFFDQLKKCGKYSGKCVNFLGNVNYQTWKLVIYKLILELQFLNFADFDLSEITIWNQFKYNIEFY